MTVFKWIQILVCVRERLLSSWEQLITASKLKHQNQPQELEKAASDQQQMPSR